MFQFANDLFIHGFGAFCGSFATIVAAAKLRQRIAIGLCFLRLRAPPECVNLPFLQLEDSPWIKPKVYATHSLFEPARKLLEARCDVDYRRGPISPSRATLLEHVAGKDALICLLTEKINDEVLDAAPKLRIVANVAVGFDNIDVPACTRHKVFASNTPGVLDETTADFAWTLLMAVARRLLEGDRLTRSGQWTGWDLDQLCGADVWGKTLGLVGFGRIGRAVARRARGFNMRIIYTDAVRAPLDAEREFSAEFVSADRLFAESDFISLHVPLLPETARPGVYKAPRANEALCISH